MTPQTGGSPSSIVRSIVLAPIESLRSYEVPDTAGVTQIARSLADTGTLLDPVVGDLGRKMLIDGHHRCAALRTLGIDHVATFDIDYFSPRVEVRGWVRTSNIPVDEMGGMFPSDIPTETGDWWVVADMGPDRLIAVRRYQKALLAAHFVQQLSDRVEAGGWSVSLNVENHLPDPPGRSVRFFVAPIIGKSQVWEAVQTQAPFPNEVNRHLIQGRPVAFRIPLECQSSPERLADWLTMRFSGPDRTVAKPGGALVNGRYYDESIVVPADELQAVEQSV
jgi:hypothetical protein